MKKYILIVSFITVVLATACTPQKKTLYTWGNYDSVSYNYIKTETDENLDKLLASYEGLIENQKGLRKEVPPGVCADYGFLLYKKGKKAEALAMLKKEVTLYPESATFINRIIKKIEQ